MRPVFSAVAFVVLFSQSVLADVNLDARSVRQCYQCSGIACSRTSLRNVTVTCGDPLDACVTVFDEYTPVVRGCFLEIPDKYRSKCEQGSIACDKCAGSLCNKYARADVICLQCDSSTDPGCLYNPSRMQPKRCPLTPTPNSYCFIRYSRNGTVFGCTSSLKDQRSCYNDENCLLCLPDGRGVCNAVDFPTGRRQCLVCSEKGCREGGPFAAYCTKANDQCVALKMNGKVLRGCLSSLNETQSTFCTNNSTMCSKCNVNNCNTDFEDDISSEGNGAENGGNGGNGGENGGNGGNDGGNGGNGGNGGENGGNGGENGGNGGENGGNGGENGGNGGENGGNGGNGGENGGNGGENGGNGGGNGGNGGNDGGNGGNGGNGGENGGNGGENGGNGGNGGENGGNGGENGGGGGASAMQTSFLVFCLTLFIFGH